MRILALDSALARCSAAVVADDQVLALRQQDAARNQSGLLPVMVAEVLQAAGLRAGDLDFVAVTVGPGSFTGLRAGLALAHGIGLAAEIPVIGVTVGEALCAALPPVAGRQVWVAIDSRRGRVFLERDGLVAAHALDALPEASHPVAVAGDAAIEVAARLAARGANVMLTSVRLPEARYVAMAALARHRGLLPALDAQPLYVDPPEARLPAAGLRPAPLA